MFKKLIGSSIVLLILGLFLGCGSGGGSSSGFVRTNGVLATGTYSGTDAGLNTVLLTIVISGSTISGSGTINGGNVSSGTFDVSGTSNGGTGTITVNNPSGGCSSLNATGPFLVFHNGNTVHVTLSGTYCGGSAMSGEKLIFTKQ